VYTIVFLEDWVVLYDPEGKCVYQDHSISEDKMLDLLKIKYEVIIDDEVVRDYAYENGYLPNNLSDLPRS